MNSHPKRIDTPKLTDIINEEDFHQRIINTLDQLPEELKTTSDSSVLAWANELRIHDGSRRRQHSDGSADLLTLDEYGRTWIIEVKLADNAELNANVWEQVIRYKEGLQTMSWDKIHEYLDRFLNGKGSVTPYYPQFYSKKNLQEVIEEWQRIIGRRRLSPSEIIDRVANALKNGTAGIAVISTGYCESVTEGARNLNHRGSIAYVSTLPTETGLKHQLSYYLENQTSTQITKHAECRDFEEYRKEKLKKLEIDDFQNKLHPNIRPIWENIVKPSFIELGWDTKLDQTQQKGNTITLICRNNKLPLLRFAYSDTDTSNISREYKTPGFYGLRVDIAVSHLTKSKKLSRPEIENLASRVYSLGWRGSGAGKLAGIESLDEDKYKKWSYMRYAPSDDKKDFLGRPGEEEILRNFFHEIKKFCNGE